MIRLIVMVLVVVAGSAHAQTSASKKELINKLLQLQQPAIEVVARQMAEQPAMLLGQRAGQLLQSRIPPERREAVARDLQGDLKKYVDETVPLVRERAIKLAPTTIGAIIDEKFTEDELKQLIAIIESPVNRKFLQLGGDMQKALADKLVAEIRPLVDGKIRTMEVAIAGHLGIPVTTPVGAASGAAAAPRAPARAASN